MSNVVAQVRQGHLYRWDSPRDRYTSVTVLALKVGPDDVRVGELVPGQPWLGRIFHVAAVDLQRLPMVYFHGEVPR